MRLPMIFQDGMMLQREKAVSLRGSSNPGGRIRIQIQGKTVDTTADDIGNWSVTLPPLYASNEEILRICEYEDEKLAEEITLGDIAIGEIWTGGGQSNMEFALRYEKHRKDPTVVYPLEGLRFYDVPKIAFDGQYESFDYSRVGRWRKALTQEDLDFFCALGYYFQKELLTDLGVPVGIVGCNWGGTRSAAWISPESVQRVGEPWLKEYEEFVQELDPELPFLIVQLPGWEKRINLRHYDYMTIRQCQQEVTDKVPGTYLCSISDAGEQLDIHPKDKKIVGERLALLARHYVYGEDVPCDPPRVGGVCQISGNTIELSFENTYGSLPVRGERVEALKVYDGTGACSI